jgi:tetratricopeptide (TPR) repeat protein
MSTRSRSLLLALALAGCAHKQQVDDEKPKLAPAKPEAIEAFKDGARLVRLGAAHYDRAQERLEAATQLDSRMWEAFYDLGWLALEQRQYDNAVKALEKSVDIYPRHLPSTLALGRAYEETGRPEAAAKVYKNFLDGKWKVPSSDGVALRVALGSALRRSGKLDAALESLRDALKVEPRSAPALAGMGLIYEAKGRHELAELVLHRALDIDGKGRLAADVWNNLGLIALSRRHDQEAFADFAEAAKLDPTLTSARRNRAVVYLDCGDYEKAASELREVVKVDENDGAAWVALGVAERGRGQPDAAEKAYKKVLDLGASAGSAADDARYNLGVLYMDFKKDPAKARDLLAEFLKKAPAKHGKIKDAETRMKDLAPKADAPAQSNGGSTAQPAPAGGKPGGGNGK